MDGRDSIRKRRFQLLTKLLKGQRKKIAIVSFEFEGLTKNGGIGTAYRRMAELLVRDGHDVTIIYMPFHRPKTKKQRLDFVARLKKIRRRGIKFILPDEGSFAFQLKFDFYHQRRAMLVYEALKERDFDIVHSADNCGLTYFAVLAQKGGLEFQQTKFIVGAHGSTFWAAYANGDFTAEAVLLAQYDQECAESADVLVSPSSYMLNYLTKLGWRLPEQSFTFPNVNNFIQERNSKKVKGASKSLVFFGRLERRKGVFLFVEALLELLHKNPEIGLGRPLKVVFLGSEIQKIMEASPSDFIRGRTEHLRHRIKLVFLTNLSSAESNKYLHNEEPKLVCMPSLVDNSPYVIVEALERNLDFICANSGGQAELIDPRDHKVVLFTPELNALADALKRRLSMPAYQARPSRNVLQANDWWSKFHAKLKQKKKRKSSPASPKISVVLGFQPSFPEHLLLRSLESLLNQNYPNLEILISAVGGNRESLRAKCPKAKFISNSLGETIQQATGKFLFFLDGAEFTTRDALHNLVQAFDVNAEQKSRLLGISAIVICSLNHPNREEWNVPVPFSLDRIVAGQVLASTYALWRRSYFSRVFEVTPSSMIHDLYLRPLIAEAFVQGYSIATIPNRLLRSLTPEWRRLSQVPADASVIEPLLPIFPKERRHLLPTLLGYAKDYDLFRNAYYLEREKRLK